MSIRLQVLIPEELDASVGKAAARQGVSKGEWVRKAIRRALLSDMGEGAGGADPLDRLAALDAPTGDIDQMLMEIEQGRQ